jgi:hypothetical protein
MRPAYTQRDLFSRQANRVMLPDQQNRIRVALIGKLA